MKKMLEKKLKELDAYVVQARKSLKKAPEGSLVLSKSNGTTQYYHKTEIGQKKGKYISTKNSKLICALAQKDYDLRFLQLLTEQRVRLCKAIKLIAGIDFLKPYHDLSEARRKLVKPYVMTDEQYVENWLSVEYSGKELFEDNSVLITERGEKVRSKTEKILADKFYSMGIPYRYEYPVNLKGYGTVYPDFTLLNIRERKEIYFEHFGMMDHPEYCQKAILKLENYTRSGIYIGKNLLVTFETFRNSLDMKTVEQMLKEFIL